MIRALLKKQLLELGAAFVRSSKTGKQRSRVGTLGYALLFAVLMLLVMLSFGSMALPLAVTLVPQGLAWLYFVLMELSQKGRYHGQRRRAAAAAGLFD